MRTVSCVKRENTLIFVFFLPHFRVCTSTEMSLSKLTMNANSSVRQQISSGHLKPQQYPEGMRICTTERVVKMYIYAWLIPQHGFCLNPFLSFPQPNEKEGITPTYWGKFFFVLSATDAMPHTKTSSDTLVWRKASIKLASSTPVPIHRSGDPGFPMLLLLRQVNQWSERS